MGLKGLLFDKDGTLIDFDATWGPAVEAVMRHLAAGDRGRLARLMEVSHFLEDERRFLPSSPLVAGSTQAFAPDWAEALGRVPDAAFCAEVDGLLGRHGLESLTPIGDPAALFDRLAMRGLALGVATNDSEASARAQAQALGIAARCPFIAGYDSGWGAKPGPGMITAFVEASGLEPSEVALVGDSLHDLHAAKAAGVVAIAVLSGPRRAAARADLEPHADHVLASIVDLEAFLDTLPLR